ncbi:MAG: hypothetical protein KDA28_04855 [Phycisphaerales bacterium]|nr:hypothetical protein [Phycisphaerales bacterium]
MHTIVLAAMSGLLGMEPMETFSGDLAISDGIAGLNISVDGDGILDLNLGYYGVSVNSIFGWNAIVRSADEASELQTMQSLDENSYFVLTRLVPGDVISDDTFVGDAFIANAGYADFFNGVDGGAWLDQTPGFFGFSFRIGNERHYGYGEIRIGNDGTEGEGDLHLLRLVYETVPGAPLEVEGGCAADLAEPFGTLDIFDLLEFLALFDAEDDGADWNGDTVFDIFDVIGFLDDFGSC